MKTKETTDVAEDLRNEYQTGKLVPYQSVICEGKIVGNSKIKLNEAEVFRGLSKDEFLQKVTEMAENSEDYSSDFMKNDIPSDRLISTYLKVCLDTLRDNQDEIFEKTIAIASEDT